MTSVAVVIPFFQREPGILRKALEGVRRQVLESGTTLRVIVVDDVSPQPPADEISGLVLPSGVTLEILRQRENGGPGAARNRALDHVLETPPDFIAFLDSDDVWAPDHVSRALKALGEARDFFFEDHVPLLGDAPSYFWSDKDLPKEFAGGGLGLIEPCPGEPDLFRPVKGRETELFLRHLMAHTSTVVYRFARNAQLRFEPSLRSAGEDILFWIHLAKAARALCFSTHAGVSCGRGVNVYYSTLNWDRPGVITRVGNQLMLWLLLTREIAETESEKSIARRQVERYGRALGYLFVRAVARGRPREDEIFKALRRRYGWGMTHLAAGAAAAGFSRVMGKLAVDDGI